MDERFLFHRDFISACNEKSLFHAVDKSTRREQYSGPVRRRVRPAPYGGIVHTVALDPLQAGRCLFGVPDGDVIPSA